MDRDLVERARRAIARRSPSWCTRSATRSTRSPSGSCATRASPRTRCRTPSCSPGAGCPSSGIPTASRPGSIGSSSTPATTSPSGPGRGGRPSPSCPIELPGRRTSTSAIADRDELERAFRHVSIEQRAVFVLHHYLGLPLVEVAELLGIPAGTARSRLHYAIAGLRRPSRPRRSPSPGKDDSHDRRSIARTRRSIVARGGPDAGPRPPVEAALARIQTTRQERDLRIPWRLPTMTTQPPRRGRRHRRARRRRRPRSCSSDPDGPTSASARRPTSTAPATPIADARSLAAGIVEHDDRPGTTDSSSTFEAGRWTPRRARCARHQQSATYAPRRRHADLHARRMQRDVRRCRSRLDRRSLTFGTAGPMIPRRPDAGCDGTARRRVLAFDRCGWLDSDRLHRGRRRAASIRGRTDRRRPR